MPMVVRKPGFRIARSYEVAFSPSGDRLASVAVHVDLWDVATRTRAARGHPFTHPSHVDFSPDGTRLAVKSTSGEIVVLDALTLDLVARHNDPPLYTGAEVLFSPCGEYLIDGSWTGVLFVRDALTGDVVHRERFGTMVQHLACSGNRSRWALSAYDALTTIRSWPFTDDRLDLQVDAHNALAIDGSGRLLATVDRIGRTLQVWDLGSGAGMPTLVAEVGKLPLVGTGKVAWSPDGDMLALAGADMTRLFTSDLRELWQTELEYSCSVAFSPSGDLLACGAWSKGFVIANPVDLRPASSGLIQES
jgi:WD40 repeat protein